MPVYSLLEKSMEYKDMKGKYVSNIMAQSYKVVKCSTYIPIFPKRFVLRMDKKQLRNSLDFWLKVFSDYAERILQVTLLSIVGNSITHEILLGQWPVSIP